MADAQTLKPNIPDPLATSLLSPQSFSDVAALVNSGEALPPQFVVPETERHGLAHDAYLPDFDLPVFDLSLFAACQTQEERNRMATWLSSVCKECGFFQIVNHGVEPGLMKKMEAIGRSFFKLPTSTKEKIIGYKNNFNRSSLHSEPWLESANMMGTIESFGAGFIDRAWPGGNKEFSDCFEKYVESMEQIARTIFELLMECLGVKASTLTQGFGEDFGGVRYNYYPRCPQPELVIGLNTHTDPNVLTILYQDEVGGLQLRGKDGEWRAVKPKADAFVVNAGDSLTVLSNGVYRAVEHRAVLNSMTSRLSLGYFHSPKYGVIVRPMENLLDAEHPPSFKPFNYGEYLNYRLATRSLGSLTAYAGIQA